ARELYLLMKYAGVTDGDLYHGHMRFDLNVSVCSEPGKLGTRSETKNLNSFRSIEAAVDYEINRQVELLEKGQKIVQETRGWDEAKQKTIAQRTKEEAEDYRYMPEPDIPPIELEDGYINRIKKNMPRLPKDIRAELSRLDINAQVIEDIMDRPSSIRPILAVLEAAKPQDARRVAFWLIHAEPLEDEFEANIEPEVDAQRLILLSQMVESNELSSTAAKTVFDELLSSSDGPRELATRLNLLQLTDESQIEKIVSEVIAEHPKVTADIRNGQTKAISFLVGQVMAKSKGQANPQIAEKIIKKQLDV
ncbi:MAG TPA: Asp-tRNA(Asn)/Glu-tRNA(Gln) amidotransferase subunit GatB, partial [Candidatus Saccharimonadales bacterium]|nr:Asp-tRNA(Asn)/Glu-tRNA(Gln) amidotransferase subunit GatB [Candidatus Saccharimonadales bacterium]